MTCLALGSWPNNGARYEFCFVEHNLNPIRKWDGWLFLLMPMSLLHHWHVLPGQSLLELTGFSAGNGNFVFLPSLVFLLTFSKLLLLQSALESSSLALSCKSNPPPPTKTDGYCHSLGLYSEISELQGARLLNWVIISRVSRSPLPSSFSAPYSSL